MASPAVAASPVAARVTHAHLPEDVTLSERDLCDLEMFTIGAFAPLAGYLSFDDFCRVVEESRLADGRVWPMPFVLPVAEGVAAGAGAGAEAGAGAGGPAPAVSGREIRLRDVFGTVLARVTVNSCYRPDIPAVCARLLGTQELAHPYARYMHEAHADALYVGGAIAVAHPVQRFDFRELRRSAPEVRTEIARRGWDCVVGFQTRNPMHRSHFELTVQALREVEAETGKKAHLLLTPACGPTQKGDIPYTVRVRCYKALLPFYEGESGGSAAGATAAAKDAPAIVASATVAAADAASTDAPASVAPAAAAPARSASAKRGSAAVAGGAGGAETAAAAMCDVGPDVAAAAGGGVAGAAAGGAGNGGVAAAGAAGAAAAGTAGAAGAAGGLTGNSRACLVLLPLAMRMAGPREALWHALIRKNFGCTHFIVGRDHAGPSARRADGSAFYGPYDAHAYLKKFAAEIGISPVFGRNMLYLGEELGYVQEDRVPAGAAASAQAISGTRFRAMLENREPVPSWYSFRPVVDVLHAVYRRRSEQGFCVYFTGLPCSGKSTLAEAVAARVRERDAERRETTLLDADVIRTHLSRGLGFSRADRQCNVRRIGYVASVVVRHGGICLVANIAPYEEDRAANRAAVAEAGGGYVEVHVCTPLEICEARDVKGLYRKARAGVISQFTGVSDPYEPPQNPELAVDSSKMDIDTAVDQVMHYLEKHGWIAPATAGAGGARGASAAAAGAAAVGAAPAAACVSG